MLNRKVRRVLSERIDTPDLIETLKHLSTFYSENTLENRRNLRSVLEKQGQSLNEQFIESFQSIVDDFEKVAKSVDGLSNECQHIETILNQTKDATNTLISTTTKLRNEKIHVEKKEKIVNSFLNRFQLSQSEKKIFNEFIYNNTITFELFDVFEKMIIIRNDCKKLLNNYHQRASLDIMDRFAKQLESGYEKLYRSVQKTARTLGIDINILIQENDINLQLFTRSLFQLRQRGGYFEHCCQELSSARRLYWVQKFINVLTRGDKPIEMYAYDPVRYLNDMLTWIHNSLSQETQFILYIFKYKEYSTKRKLNYLDRVSEGLFRPLSMRILSILNNNIDKIQSKDLSFSYDVVTAYRLCHVLDFYVITIRQIFQQFNHEKDEKDEKDIQLKFINSLQDLRKTSYNKFHKMVQYRMDKYLDSSSYLLNSSSKNNTQSSSLACVINIASDLTPNKVFKDHLQRLNDIMSIYSTNLVPNNLKIEDFTSVLNCFIDPMLQVVNKSVYNLTETEKCVYLINILVIILDTLKTQPFGKHSARFETLSLLIETQKEKLIKSESNFILKDCGVFTVLFTLKQHKQNQRPNNIQKLCNVSGLDETSIKLAMKSLIAYIFSLGALSMPKIEKITDLNIRSTTRNGVAETIFSAYQLLYDTLSNTNNGYQNVKHELTHSSKEVRQVLQLN